MAPVFLLLAVSLRIPVRGGHPPSRLPFGGAFELVQLVDPDLAASLARDIAAGTSTAVRYADPTLDRVQEKTFKKRYVTAHPTELLVYGDDLMLPYDVWHPKFEKDLKDFLDGSAFRRLWVVNLTPRESSRRVWLVYPPYMPSGR